MEEGLGKDGMRCEDNWLYYEVKKKKFKSLFHNQIWQRDAYPYSSSKFIL
jgi:hypothetical protein